MKKCPMFPEGDCDVCGFAYDCSQKGDGCWNCTSLRYDGFCTLQKRYTTDFNYCSFHTLKGKESG